MAGTPKPPAHKPGNFAGSFFEQLNDNLKDETGKFASGIGNSILGRFPTDSNGVGEQRAYPPLSPEFMPPLKKKQRSPEIALFTYREREDNLKTRDQIKHLMNEISRQIILIQKEQKAVLNEAAKITVEQLPEKPGIYHIRFLEWVLKTLQDLRKKVSESSEWFNMVRGKRKNGFWGMAKKHGTQFSMSGERSTATQSG